MHSHMVLASSTSTTSLMRAGGDCSSTLYTVRRSVVKSSLWKQMTTLVVGRSWAGGYWKDGHLWVGRGTPKGLPLVSGGSRRLVLVPHNHAHTPVSPATS